MESSLDEVASGKLPRLACLQGFYFGDRGLERLLSQAKSAWGVENEGYPVQMDGEELYISFNRYGEFIQKGEQRIYLNADIAPDEMNAGKLSTLMSQHSDKPEPVYLLDCPTTNRPAYLQHGRFGWYIQVGNDEKKRNNKNVGLLQEDSLRDVGAPPELSTDQILRLLELPKPMGKVDVKGTSEMLHLYIGKYGPYLKAGKSSINLHDVSDWKNTDVYTITEQEAVAIFNNPPKKKTVLRELGEDEEGNEILIKTGFFGPYVTNGSINASMGKRIVEDVTLNEALKMLVQAKNKPKRAKKGKASTKTTAKASTRKKATKKTTKSKSTTKTTRRKKADPKS